MNFFQVSSLICAATCSSVYADIWIGPTHIAPNIDINACDDAKQQVTVMVPDMDVLHSECTPMDVDAFAASSDHMKIGSEHAACGLPNANKTARTILSLIPIKGQPGFYGELQRATAFVPFVGDSMGNADVDCAEFSPEVVPYSVTFAKTNDHVAHVDTLKTKWNCTAVEKLFNEITLPYADIVNLQDGKCFDNDNYQMVVMMEIMAMGDYGTKELAYRNNGNQLLAMKNLKD